MTRPHADRACEIKIFTDGANVAPMLELAADPLVAGLHHQPDADAPGRCQGLRDVRQGAHAQITDNPISFEVIADDFAEMERQALALRAIGDNVYVKIPITDTSGTSAAPLMARLAGPASR